jgi:hypothetical protein
MRSALALLALPAILCAQAARPPQDPEALKLLDQADALIYSPRRLGLKDLRYVQSVPRQPGVVVEVAWKAPDLARVEPRAEPGRPDHVARIVAVQREQLQAEARTILDVVVGKDSREAYQDDEIRLAGPRQIRVLARSDRSRRLFREHLVTYDDRGLPFRMASETDSGRYEFEVVFTTHDGKWFVREIQSRTPTGPMVMEIEMGEFGAWRFPLRIRKTLGTEVTAIEFSDYRPDTGLTEADLR